MKHTVEAIQNGKTVTLNFPYFPQVPTGTVDVEITEHRENRSGDANAYYWTLVTELSKINNEPMPKIHNMMLRDYGTLETKNGYYIPLTLPDTEEAQKILLMEMNYHVLPTDEAWTDVSGNQFRKYLLIKGSHLYNTKEMARLINGAVQEATSQGIDTLTPDEHAEMMAAYEQFNG